MRIRFRAGIAAAMLAVIWACNGAPLTTTTALPAAIATPTAVTTATITTSAVGAEEAVLVAEADPLSNQLVLLAADPATGYPVKNRAPIDLGGSFHYTFTPDLKTLIFSSYPSAAPSEGDLHFVDLANWRDDRAILLPNTAWESAQAISPDGSRFALASVEAKQSSIWLVDARRHVVLAHVHEAGIITSLAFTADNQSLMSYGRAFATNQGPSQGPPTVELRSAEDLDVLWTRTLVDVHDGFVPNANYKGDPYEPGAGSLFTPGAAFSPTTDLLYIVHADADKLTRVDFNRKSVLTLEIKPKLGWFERWLMLAASEAYAKEQNGVERRAVISKDGSVVYAAGVQRTLAQEAPGNWLETRVPLNLQAIQTKDAAQIFKSNASGEALQLAPDGATLLLEQIDQGTGAVTGTVEVDAKSGQVTANHPSLSLQLARRLGGDPILVSAVAIEAMQPAYEMEAYSPEYQLLGQWTAPGFAEWLIAP
jgi:hypothetical protein